MEKDFKEISWLVDEPTYRADPALSYSTLAKYEREGFNKIQSLFDHVETPSLSFGSAVDSIITGGQEEFDSRFYVCDLPEMLPSVVGMVIELHKRFGGMFSNITEVPDAEIIKLSEELQFQLRWRDITRARVVKEQGGEYYRQMALAGGREILDSGVKAKVDAAVRALRESGATKWYFAPDDPFDESVRRYYQLKFKGTVDGVDYRCMADLIVVNYAEKTVYPCDLKTSSHAEWDFPLSFLQWRYDVQAREYQTLMRINMDADPYFKDFKLDNYRFIVVNKETLTPLVWEFKETKQKGDLVIGTKDGSVTLRDPFAIGKELRKYLDERPRVPNGVSLTEPNDITMNLKRR